MMRAFRYSLVTAALLLATSSSAPVLFAQAAAPTAPVVRALTDRTAMWIGDRVTYTIQIICPRGVDVLEDDLSKEKLQVDGLEVVGADATRTEGAGEVTTRRFNYVLTSYKPDVRARRIAPLKVRYYLTRPGQRLEDTPPVGSVTVPATVVAFRSMLPEDQDATGVRDARTFEPRARIYALAKPVGLGLVVLSIAPAAIWGTALLTRQRTARSQRSARQVRKEERASLEAVRALSIESVEGRREAFDQIDTLVRAHLHDATGVAGPSLTPAEVGPALSSRSSRLDPVNVASVLAICERARYGPPSAMPSTEECREALAQTELLLKLRQ
ncbi:MAG: hypothetical protein ABIS06_05440 [Vicinamibacterales bacterium]